MAATDARPVPKKGVAYRHYFAIRKNDGTLITTWAGQDSEVDKDGTGFTDCTNEATEIGTSGIGYIDLTSTEMNADAVNLKVTVTNTDALPYVVTLFPEEAGDIRTDLTQWKGTAPNDLQSGRIDSYLAAAGLQTDAVEEARNAITGGAYALSTDANGRIRIVDGTGAGELDSLSGTVLLRAATQASIDAIEADSNELQGDWADGGRLDLILDSRASQTSVDTIDDFLDTEIALLLARTGYVDGFVYYHPDGAAGTVDGVNGTIDNPSSDDEDLITIGTARNAKRVKMLKPYKNTAPDVYFGEGHAVDFSEWLIDLNNLYLYLGTEVSIPDGDVTYYVTTQYTKFINGALYGASPSKGDEYHNIKFYRLLGIVDFMPISGDIPPKFYHCGLQQKMQFQTNFASGKWATWYNCYPVDDVDFTEIDINSKTVRLRLDGWSGDLTIKNMTSDSTVEVYGYGGRITIDSSCTGGTVRYTSHMELTNNGSGMTTDLVSEPGQVSGFTTAAKVEIESEVDDAIASYFGTAGDSLTGLRALITGGAYDLDTDANGRIRVVDGTGAGEIDATSGLVKIAGTLQTLDDLENLSADDVWDEVVDGSYTARQSMRLQNSAMAGKLSGAGGTTITIRDLDDTKNRIVATVDGDGNRSALTLVAT